MTRHHLWVFSIWWDLHKVRCEFRPPRVRLASTTTARREAPPVLRQSWSSLLLRVIHVIGFAAGPRNRAFWPVAALRRTPVAPYGQHRSLPQLSERIADTCPDGTVRCWTVDEQLPPMAQGDRLVGRV